MNELYRTELLAGMKEEEVQKLAYKSPKFSIFIKLGKADFLKKPSNWKDGK